MSLPRLLKPLLTVSALGCFAAALFLLRDLGRPERPPEDPRAPAVAVSLPKQAFPLEAAIPLFVEIRNGGDAPVWINDPADDLFLLSEEGDDLLVMQHFPERILKDPLANRFSDRGGLPAFRKLEPGDEVAKTIRVRNRFERGGPRTLRYALGYGIAPPETSIPAPPATPAERIARFLAWQRRVEAPPIPIEIEEK